MKLGPTLIAALLFSIPSFATTSGDTPDSDPRLGSWREQGGSRALLLEENRGGLFEGQSPRFFRAIYSNSGVSFESWARHTTFELTLDGDSLHVVSANIDMRMTRVEQVPDELQVSPYELPMEVELTDGMVTFLKEDLRQRLVEDQRVRQNAGPGQDMSGMQRVDEDNTEFLRNIIAETGWIDATRFGVKASDAAFMIVQHTNDLRLMRTALPLIEADVRAGRLDGQNYALLFDRLQLRLGYLQKYGTQLTTVDGNKLLMPCEDIKRVDEFRAELGMGELSSYLAYFKGPADPPIHHLGLGQYEYANEPSPTSE